MGYFEKHQFPIKTVVATFWPLFEEFGLLFIPTSGHTDSLTTRYMGARVRFFHIEVYLFTHNIFLIFSLVLSLCLLLFNRIFVVFFIKMGHSRPLFLYFRLFNTVDSKCSIYKFLPMTGYEPQTSGIGSNCFTNHSHNHYLLPT